MSFNSGRVSLLLVRDAVEVRYCMPASHRVIHDLPLLVQVADEFASNLNLTGVEICGRPKVSYHNGSNDQRHVYPEEVVEIGRSNNEVEEHWYNLKHYRLEEVNDRVSQVSGLIQLARSFAVVEFAGQIHDIIVGCGTDSLVCTLFDW